jgi:hypothetical protein
METDNTNLKSEWKKEKDVRPKTKTNATNKALYNSEGERRSMSIPIISMRMRAEACGPRLP